jgi:predicted 2-oxoglutarate/Fe(II)-dependent dioxygenase YbiX
MNNHIKVIENFLSKDECEFILFKYKNELKLSSAQTSKGIDKNRKSSVGWIDELNGINERLTDLLKTSYDINGMEVTGLGPFQFTEYKVGEYFDWHTDRGGEIYRDRFVSTVIQLNDNYSGGVLEIKDVQNNLIPIKQKAGNLYVFESGLKHRVTPVEDGIRYSLVNWISLVKTDSNKQNIL